ncbi:MAG: cytochrome c [Lentisphaeria bacterium]|nr:cytochrome c [Candidatus Neomarinimicrobiota bacterium]MCF7843194.1 cytochrome c [Lentisphaeria bacterium]
MYKIVSVLVSLLILLLLETCGNDALQKTKTGLDKASISRGKQLFQQYRCVQCHGDDGTSGFADLSKTGEKYSIQEVKTWIANPSSMKPGASMPAFNMLQDEQVSDLAQFVISLGE